MNEDIRLIHKKQVCELLGICDRTLEKLVKSRQFPPPLRLGKKIAWVDTVVNQWLMNAVAPQLQWEPPRQLGAIKSSR